MFRVLIFSPVVTFRFPLSRAAVRCFLTSSSFGRWTLGLVPCLMGFSFRYVCSLHSPNSSSPRSSGKSRRSEQPWHHILLSSSSMPPTLWELIVDLVCSWAWDPVQNNPYLSYSRVCPQPAYFWLLGVQFACSPWILTCKGVPFSFIICLMTLMTDVGWTPG